VELIEIGTVVTVTHVPVRYLDGTVERPRAPYRAMVRGYDDFRTKYELGREYAPHRFARGGTWAFLIEVEETAMVEAR
jgi:hypothetical protein